MKSSTSMVISMGTAAHFRCLALLVSDTAEPNIRTSPHQVREKKKSLNVDDHARSDRFCRIVLLLLRTGGRDHHWNTVLCARRSEWDVHAEIIGAKRSKVNQWMMFNAWRPCFFPSDHIIAFESMHIDHCSFIFVQQLDCWEKRRRKRKFSMKVFSGDELRVNRFVESRTDYWHCPRVDNYSNWKHFP